MAKVLASPVALRELGFHDTQAVGAVAGQFAGDYSDALLSALLAACEAKPKPALESFGRDLQPYFSADEDVPLPGASARISEKGTPSKAKPSVAKKVPKKPRSVAGDTKVPGGSGPGPNKRSKSAPAPAARPASVLLPSMASPVRRSTLPPSHIKQAGAAAPATTPLGTPLELQLGVDINKPVWSGPAYTNSPVPMEVPRPTSLFLTVPDGPSSASHTLKRLLHIPQVHVPGFEVQA